MEHGYDLLLEGTYLGHRIFTKKSIEKNSFFRRMFNSSLWGHLYSVHTVANFEEEPWFNASEGCISDKVASINIIDQRYHKQLETILGEIEEYSRRIHGISFEDRKEPMVLSYS